MKKEGKYVIIIIAYNKKRKVLEDGTGSRSPFEKCRRCGKTTPPKAFLKTKKTDLRYKRYLRSTFYKTKNKLEKNG